MDAARTPIGNLSEARFSEPGTALHRLLMEAAYLPRCSDNKTASMVRPREYAIRWPYMQVNRPGMVSWLIFDLDHANPLIWEEVGLPAPNLVVINRNNQHSHVFYAIAPVCTTENARSAPINYMKAVYAAMAAKLNADPAYSGPVAKTPGHPWWLTQEIHNHQYDLGKLADYVELEVKPRWCKEPDIDSVSHSRHCMLFEQLRFFAYSIVNREREQGSYRSFMRKVEEYAFSKNNFRQHGFSMNLTVAQVKSTIKSVARWTWDFYTGSADCNRGVMHLDKSLPLEERQRLAAQRTHQARQNSTQAKIRVACTELARKGKERTQSAIAAAAGLSRQTVAKYQKTITDLIENQQAKKTAKQGVLGKTNDVKYAVYQISALGVFRDAVLEKVVKPVIPGPVQEELLACLEPPDD